MDNTPKLTDLEKNILKLAGLAGDYRLSIEEIAEQLKCRPDTIYARLQNEEFRSLFLEVTRNSITADAFDTLTAFREKAKEGEFRHGKLLLEIAGIYQDKKIVKADIGVYEGDNPFKDEQERKTFLLATLDKLGVTSSD